MRKKYLKIIVVGLILATAQTGCRCYEVRQIGKEWGVFRSSALIPDYTQTARYTYAPTQEDAERLFQKRKKGLEKFIQKKYGRDKRHWHDYVRPFLVPLTIPLDLVAVMPLELIMNGVRKMKKEETEPFFAFPMTQIICNWECTYSTIGTEIFRAFVGIIPAHPTEEWKQNPEAQAELEAFLKETET